MYCNSMILLSLAISLGYLQSLFHMLYITINHFPNCTDSTRKSRNFRVENISWDKFSLEATPYRMH